MLGNDGLKVEGHEGLSDTLKQSQNITWVNLPV